MRNDPCFIGIAEVVRTTDMAILVIVQHGKHEAKELWVPRSVIHGYSEVQDDDDSGRLIVEEWWAKEMNLE